MRTLVNTYNTGKHFIQNIPHDCAEKTRKGNRRE